MAIAKRDQLTVFEKNWLTAFLVIIVGATIWFSYTGTDWHDWKSITLNWVISPLSSITGVVCVVLSAKGKLSNWIWGLINSIAYGFVAWVSGYYGDWLLNWFFFIPTQIIIFFVWRSHLQNSSTIVKMKSLKWNTTWVVLAAILMTILFANILISVDNFFTESMRRSSVYYANIARLSGLTILGPLLDSSTVVLQIIAEFLLILMYADQWPFWLATNIITIFIWIIVILTDSTSYSYAIPTLLMWIAFLINSLYGGYNWYRNVQVTA